MTLPDRIIYKAGMGPFRTLPVYLGPFGTPPDRNICLAGAFLNLFRQSIPILRGLTVHIQGLLLNREAIYLNWLGAADGNNAARIIKHRNHRRKPKTFTKTYFKRPTLYRLYYIFLFSII
jgi:hypothetical protein